MTTSTFHQHFDQNIPEIQNLASKLAKDFDTARFLYLETVHQAMKSKNQLQADKLEEWLITTMEKIYRKISHSKSGVVFN